MDKDVSSSLKLSVFGKNNLSETLSNFHNNLSTISLNYQIIDAISASIYLKDTNGVYLGCNKYMAKMAGLASKEQIIGKTDYDMSWSSQAKQISEIDKLVVCNNQTYQLEEKPKIYDGSIRVMLSSKTPLLGDDGNIIGIIGVSIDITDQKSIEKKLELTEEYLERSVTIKERFVRNINHETRNPMCSIVGNADLLEEKWDVLDDKQKYEIVKLIATSSRRLAQLVNNTFDLSNLLNNDARLHLEKNNISELVESAVQSFDYLKEANCKKIRIVVKNKIAKTYKFVFDKQKIRQVMDNLLMNAIKWTSQGEVITVELYRDFIYQSSGISGVYCHVSNNGILIPDDELDFIFGLFTESSNTASMACGKGLGLALCREIIKAHHGEIKAKNNSTGVSITFFIPANLTESTEL